MQTSCQLIRFTLAIEAFVGVAVASFCSAMLFTKMQRVEYGANIEFSSCLCLQYGRGVTDAKVDVLHSVGELDSPSSTVTSFPIIEMRLVNTVSELVCVTTNLASSITRLSTVFDLQYISARQCIGRRDCQCIDQVRCYFSSTDKLY